MSDLIENNFEEIFKLIQESRYNALKAVNKELINLYWNVGAYITKKVDSDEWGKQTIQRLSDYIQQKQPEVKGFSASNLWRMKQFYETYKDNSKLAPLVREINWTSNLLILAKTKTDDEKEFYLKLAIKEKYSKRELERQLDSCYYERFINSKGQLSPSLLEIHPQAEKIFKDNYMFDFLRLPDSHTEDDLQKAIVKNLKTFILECGKDFSFIGEEYRIHVGNHDYYIDLLFYHRELSCLVAFELKIDEFKPEYIGKLNFYLEALDRDIKKSHEKPSIGILLCKTKDEIVVEYALSRSISPALIAEYQTKLIDKQVLYDKVQKIIEENKSSSDN